MRPGLPPQAVKTYALRRPWRPEYWRAATCEESGCVHFRDGWETILPGGDPRCDYIRAASGRRFTETARPEGLVSFRFAAGQTCFAHAHRVPIDREPVLLVVDGPNPPRVHVRGEDWIDDFRTHVDRVAPYIEGG